MATTRIGLILDGDARGAIDAGEDAAAALRAVADAADKAGEEAAASIAVMGDELVTVAKDAGTTTAAIGQLGTQSDETTREIRDLVAAIAAAAVRANELRAEQMDLARSQEAARIAAAALARAEREQAAAARDAARAARELERAQEAQARATADAARESDRQRKAVMDSLTSGVTSAAAMVVGVEAMRRAWEMLTAQVGAYYDRSEELTAQKEALTAQIDQMSDSILGAVITQENSEAVLGALQTAARAVGDEFEGVAVSQDTARMAAGVLLRVMAAGVSVVRGVHSGFVAVRLALIAGEAAQYAWTSAIVRMGATVAEFVTGSLAGMIQGLTDLARAALPASALLGEGVGGALRGIVAQGDATAASLRGTRDGLAAMGEEMRAQTTRAMAEYRAEATRAIEQATVLDAVLEGVQDTLRGVAADAEAGRTSLERLGEATEDTGNVARQAAVDYAALKDALVSYMLAKQAQLAAEIADREARELAAAAQLEAVRIEKIKIEAMERQAIAAETEAKLTRIAEAALKEREAAEQAALRSYVEAQQERGRVLVATTGRVLAGQEKAADAFRSVLGDELGALAEQYAAIAVARALVLDLVGAAGYGAAAAGLATASAAMGGSSSGSGGVPSAAATPTVVQESRTDIRINASGIINDDVVSQIAQGVGEASRRGML